MSLKGHFGAVVIFKTGKSSHRNGILWWKIFKSRDNLFCGMASNGRIYKKDGGQMRCGKVSWNGSFAFCETIDGNRSENEAVPAHNVERVTYQK